MAMVSYAHQNDPAGTRYCQDEDSMLPEWAINVLPYTPAPELALQGPIDKIIAHLRSELEYYKAPGSYMDAEYYVRCEAKADLLESLLDYALDCKSLAE